ncbi:MAG: SIR2 family protein [Saprospiraceae bacterium]|nr:SIR2 family protein [Saprospiraceae bacterium]
MHLIPELLPLAGKPELAEPQKMKTKPTPNIDWDLTLDTILAGKCILFLGPEVFTNATGQTLDGRLFQYLNMTDDPDVKIYSDNLFFFRVRQKRTETYLKIRRFFDETQFPEADALFEKIARIPFHFIILVTADKRLSAVYDRLELNHRSDFYWKKNPSDQQAPIPTVKKPLVYNLLGSIEKPESLVLTHDDLFDYLESVFQAQSMSDKLKDHIINTAQSIIFLGIPFDRWYMQLLLRVLHLHKDEEFMRFATEQELSDEVRTLFREQFKINFVPTNIATFIDELYTRCENRGMLRLVGQSQPSTMQALRELLAKDQLEELFEDFVSWLGEIGNSGKDLLEEVTLLAGRFRHLRKKINHGILSNDDAGRETNKIRTSLLELIREAEKFD